MTQSLKFPRYGPYPQTVQEAIEHGWTGIRLSFWFCREICAREAMIVFADLADQGRATCSLAEVYENAICARCDRRPAGAHLAHRLSMQALVSWHDRPVHFRNGRSVSPGLAPGADVRQGAERLPPDHLVPTIESLNNDAGWIWIVCNRCMHRKAFRIPSLIQQWGRETSSNVLLRAMRCSRCEWKRAGFQHPSWGGSNKGWASFPVEDQD